MRRVRLDVGQDVTEVASRLERCLPAGTEVERSDHETLSIRQGRVRRCTVRVRSAPEGPSVEIRGDGSGVPLPALALLLRYLNERRFATALAVALEGPDAPGSRS
jgi:hypothetical protein